MRHISRYPEGWIDPEIFGGILACVGLLVLAIVAVVVVIKTYNDND